MRNGITQSLVESRTVANLCVFLLRDHDYSCIERERERENLFYLHCLLSNRLNPLARFLIVRFTGEVFNFSSFV